MRTVIGCVVIALAAAPASANVSVLDNNKKVNVDCAKDPEIQILGNHITVAATGLCTRILVAGNHAVVTGSAVAVDVSGNHATVTLEGADDVSVTGNQNTVIVKKPAKAKAARISVTGNDNNVTRPK